MGLETVAEERIAVSEVLRWPTTANDKVSHPRKRRKNSGSRRGSKDTQGTSGVVEAAFEKSEGISREQDSGSVVVGGEAGAAGRPGPSDGKRLQASAPGLPRIRLRAALAQGRKCISYDTDGECQVIIDIPGSYLPEALKLTIYRGKAFWVEIYE